MKSRHSSLFDLVTPIQPLLADMIVEIERRLYLDNDMVLESYGANCCEEDEDIIVSSICNGRALSIASQAPRSASEKAMRISVTGLENTEFKVLYVSRTLSEYDLACNLIAQASFINANKLLSGRLTDAEWDRLEVALARIHALDFSLTHTQRIAPELVRDWLVSASTIAGSTPIVVLDDALLLKDFKHCCEEERLCALFEDVSLASLGNSLVVLVEHRWAH